MARLARDESGFTMIEMLVAMMILVVGILGAFMAFDASQRISLISERHTAMTQMAQQQMEQVLGMDYSDIALYCGGSSPNTCPAKSSDPTNPDHYVSSDGTQYQWDRTGVSASESLDTEGTDSGGIQPQTAWNQTSNAGNLSGNVYVFVTEADDPHCAPGCLLTGGNYSYKRITVAVTMTSGLQPNPVYLTSVIADPNAISNQGTVNGTAGNPVLNPNVNCQTGTGTSGPCTNGLGTGNANTWFLHDWAATTSGTPTDPTANNTTHPTAGLIPGGTCTSVPAQTGTQTLVNGCPVPDLMDNNVPTGNATTPVYNYATDQCSVTASCYPGGREVQAAGLGTGSSTDCNNASSYSATLVSTQNEMWVSPPLGSSATLTGAGGLTIYTQLLNSATQNPTVSFCVEIYDVPPSGSAGALTDLFAYPPVALGGAGYVAPTSGSGGNWPASATQVAFEFTFAQSAVTVPAGDRIGLRIWEESNPSMPIAVIYDNPNYPSQLQLNSQ